MVFIALFMIIGGLLGWYYSCAFSKLGRVGEVIFGALVVGILGFMVTAVWSEVVCSPNHFVETNSYELVEVSAEKYVSVSLVDNVVSCGFKTPDDFVYYKRIDSSDVEIVYSKATKPRCEVSEYEYSIWSGKVFGTCDLLGDKDYKYKIYIPDDSYLTTKAEVKK